MTGHAHVGLSHAARVRVLLLVAGAGLAVLLGSAQGRLTLELEVAQGLDAILTPDASASAAADALVDLHDGRSRVPGRWKDAFARFAASDRAGLPPPNGVVFVGGSSIDYWRDLKAQFPTQNVVQRGLPAATIADCTRHADRLILPYRPRVVVVYAGDNDLAGGDAPERVTARFVNLVDTVHREQPATKLVFVSIKPSPVRAALLPAIRRTNALIEAYTRTDRRLDFVDVFTEMLDRDAHVRPGLFRADGLHMTPAGYAIWREALVAHLD